MTEEGLATQLMTGFGFSREQVTLGIRARFRCEYCGRDMLASVDDYRAWETDHIVPTSKGGPADNIENWALSCWTCNRIKRNWLPEAVGFEGLSREEQIRIARTHIQKNRAEKQLEIAKMRQLICAFLC